MFGLSLKYISLGLLVLQNSALVLLISFSRNVEGPMYLSSTAVTVMEIVKVLVCCGVIFMTLGGFKQLIRTLQVEIINKPMELAKLALPSFLYMVQNNLLYEALSNLDPATYSVCYQLKTMTTALFSVILLKKRLTGLKWASLVILTGGVALAEMAARLNEVPEEKAIETLDEGKEIEVKHHLLGILCVLAATCTSGFAGVFFEMILKGSKTSLWVRNIQMGLPSIAFSLLSVYTKDFQAVRANGFFHGYTYVVWGVIALQAIGGLVVAVVVKYADNILKAFASAVSIITSCLLSALLLGFRPSLQFILGSVLVSVSIFLYSKPSTTADGNNKASKTLPLYGKYKKTISK